MRAKLKKQIGFTLIELIVVIVLLGIIAISALPRFVDLSSNARIAMLNQLVSQAESTVKLAQAKARLQGLRPSSTNPNSLQSELIVDFGFGESEVYFGNLCPESEAELGDALDFLDFMDTSFGDQISTRSDNQYALFGYIVPASGTPNDQGCYVIYDSFATPQCTFEVVTVDC